jgi:N-succinyldiaminopimelate aminotransferase
MRPAARLDGLGTTIFTEMTALAAHGRDQPRPGLPGHRRPRLGDRGGGRRAAGRREPVRAAARRPGAARRVLAHQRDFYGLEPEDVLVTFGATEAIAAALLALCDPGDEVVVLEPYYDSYAACIASRARDGGRSRCARRTSRWTATRCAPRSARARASCCSIRPTTRPGACSAATSSSDRRGVRRARPRLHQRRGLRAPGLRRRAHPAGDPARDGGADADGLQRRQVVLVHRLEDRLVLGPRRAGRATRTVKQYLTFAGGTPLQHAAAAALRLPAAT